MTDRQAELEEEIARQCGEGGFLIQLAALATFDEDNYRRLVSALEEYDEVLEDSPVLDRYVAGCLLDLEPVLLNTIAKMRDLWGCLSLIESSMLMPLSRTSSIRS